ncbi:MAG TPA: hypothetical protein VHL80_05755 [Polyangia bacterium]|nr:hypothetical protein [Polyangia bacterium]
MFGIETFDRGGRRRTARTAHGHLQREAARRRRSSHRMMAISLVALVGLVGLCYAILVS